jgi:hypothetical protein
LARAVNPKRLLLLAALALAAAIVVVPGAVAGNFDEERMGCAGEDPAICPPGTTGVAYTLPIELLGDEDEACAVYTVASGSLPPGLALHSDEARITGTPTQAGTFQFYLNVAYTREASCPFKNPSDDQFVIKIEAGQPKLTIGPEQSAVPVATVSSPYSLQMTASVPDAKTWSVVAGALPVGLTLGSANGLISGTPTAAGTSTFTVRAEIDPQRVDTKTLAITVRERVAVASAVTPPSEVGVSFVMPLAATGGTGVFTWAVTSGALPAGVGLTPTGAIVGKPTQAGRFGFTVTATDAEGRTGAYTSTLTVAERIAVVAQRLRPAQVGRFYQVRLQTTGGVQPATWRVKRGPLPRGMRFDRQLGLLYGTPTRARTYRMQFEAQDPLRVKASGAVTIVVKAAAKPKPRKKSR